MAETYSPENVVITINGVPVVGIAEGTFISVEFNSEKWEHYVGADGDVTTVENLDKTGTFTLTLKQNSATRRLLDQQYRAGNSVLVTMKDLNDGTAFGVGYVGTDGRVERPVSEDRSAELEEIEYEIKVAKLEPIVPAAS